MHHPQRPKNTDMSSGPSTFPQATTCHDHIDTFYLLSDLSTYIPI
uniref:Uncharacterized protein n=1 Tax=Arundo donax TaxID=35708 RepID=A0A0A9H831_ARUDO